MPKIIRGLANFFRPKEKPGESLGQVNGARPGLGLEYADLYIFVLFQIAPRVSMRLDTAS